MIATTSAAVTDLRANSGSPVKTLPFSELLEKLEFQQHEELDEWPIAVKWHLRANACENKSMLLSLRHCFLGSNANINCSILHHLSH